MQEVCVVCRRVDQPLTQKTNSKCCVCCAGVLIKWPKNGIYFIYVQRIQCNDSYDSLLPRVSSGSSTFNPNGSFGRTISCSLLPQCGYLLLHTTIINHSSFKNHCNKLKYNECTQCFTHFTVINADCNSKSILPHYSVMVLQW